MTILADAGPIVAFLNRRDVHHGWATEWFDHAPAPLFTCEPALTEVCFLLKRDRHDPALVLDLVSRGTLAVRFDVHEHAGRLAVLMRRYADRPMSLADACLVAMAEDAPLTRVLTTDRADFSAYRRHRHGDLAAIFPDERPAA